MPALPELLCLSPAVYAQAGAPTGAAGCVRAGSGLAKLLGSTAGVHGQLESGVCKVFGVL